jgi:hypothetical protein
MRLLQVFSIEQKWWNRCECILAVTPDLGTNRHTLRHLFQDAAPTSMTDIPDVPVSLPDCLDADMCSRERSGILPLQELLLTYLDTMSNTNKPTCNIDPEGPSFNAG